MAKKFCVIQIGSYGPSCEEFSTELERTKWLAEQDDHDDDFVQFEIDGEIESGSVCSASVGKDAQENLEDEIQKLRDRNPIVVLDPGEDVLFVGDTFRMLALGDLSLFKDKLPAGAGDASFVMPTVLELQDLVRAMPEVFKAEGWYWSYSTDEVGYHYAVHSVTGDAITHSYEHKNGILLIGTDGKSES